jgi:hypothetical protein
MKVDEGGMRVSWRIRRRLFIPWRRVFRLPSGGGFAGSCDDPISAIISAISAIFLLLGATLVIFELIAGIAATPFLLRRRKAVDVYRAGKWIGTAAMPSGSSGDVTQLRDLVRRLVTERHGSLDAALLPPGVVWTPGEQQERSRVVPGATAAGVPQQPVPPGDSLAAALVLLRHERKLSASQVRGLSARIRAEGIPSLDVLSGWLRDADVGEQDVEPIATRLFTVATFGQGAAQET